MLIQCSPIFSLQIDCIPKLRHKNIVNIAVALSPRIFPSLWLRDKKMYACINQTIWLRSTHSKLFWGLDQETHESMVQIVWSLVSNQQSLLQNTPNVTCYVTYNLNIYIKNKIPLTTV